MEASPFLSDDDYLELRRAARQALRGLGIPSNPGFTDHNIISSLREKRNLPPIDAWDEGPDDGAPERFRDEIAECVALEAPFTLGEIAIGLETITRLDS